MASRFDSEPFLHGDVASQMKPLPSDPPLKPFNYQLRRYKWRTFLSLIGPLLVLGFYAFICFQYLNRPAENDIVPEKALDARWVYYAWFITVVFILDWARTGLANFEAAALMHPRLAPTSAMELMWHTDSNWASVLWWLRGLRNVLYWPISRAPSRSQRRSLTSRPGLL